MCIIELDGNLLGKLLPWSLGLLESADNIVEGCSTPKILLLQSEFFTTLHIVVRIEYSRDSFGSLLISNRTFVFARIELLEIKLSACSPTSPESKIVGGRALVTGNYIVFSKRVSLIVVYLTWNIIGDGLYYFAAFPVAHSLPILVPVHVRTSKTQTS
jgi:hypothetical protein